MSTLPLPDMMQSFLDEAWESVVVFGQTAEFLASGHSEALVVMAHRLKGSAGLYGFPQTSRLAALMERILQGAPYYSENQRIQATEFMSQGTAVLSEALEHIASSNKESQVGLELGRLGAAELIQELAFSNPDAFKERAPRPFLDLEPEALTTPEQTSVVEELRRFFRENADFWEFFAPETHEHLDAGSQALSALINGDPQGMHLQALFRAMHTVKGAAYSVGCKPIGALAHRLEDLLVEVREGNKPWEAALAGIIAEGLETIGAMLAIAEGKYPNPATLPQKLQALENRLGVALGQASPGQPTPPVEPPLPIPTPTTAQPGRGSVRVSLDRLDALLNLAGETLTTRSRLELLAQGFQELDTVLETARARLLRTTSDFEARYLNPRLSLESPESTPAETPSSVGKTVQELFSELEFDRYDDLNILARSIAEMTNDLTEVRSALGEQIKAFQQETEGFGKLSQNLRSEVSRARLVPIGRFYTRLQRQVQQVGGQKEVRLELAGETIEIDSVLLDGLSEALLHLVNNAIIHGLEAPHERLLRGKSPEGHLSLRTRQERSTLILEISDDGAGLNLEALKQQAVERGLKTPAEVDGMTAEEATRLIFLPGLSTAKTLSDVAGRGVGMDAVANTVRRLRGELSVESWAGLGTTFRLRIPQSLVVSDLLMLEVGGQKIALPRESLVTLLTAPANQQSVEYDEAQVGIKTLSTLLGLPKVQTDEFSLAVVESQGGLVALAADRFLGLEQALVKPLAAPLSELPHLLGATVSATGEVVLVLSPSGLLSMGLGSIAATRVEAFIAERAPLLLVDDSLSVRKIVGQMLRKAGYQVVTASDGQEALELLETGNYRAVLTDLEMPRMSGFELLEEVRRRPHLSHLSVAVLTTRASSKHRDLAVELGAKAYLTKPADEVELGRFLSGV
ncbi:MAG: response regulator [Thermaceae bacterium]|nr:response regulator [Thermaceae bacterium]